MKNQSPSNFIARCSLGLALAVLLTWTPARAQSSTATPEKSMMGDKTMEPDQDQPATRQAMSMHRQAMMERHQAMMADLKAQDAALTAQVAKLNSAPKAQKVELLAAIVTDLVKQRTAMNARMQEMQGQMTMPAMQPMPMGKDSMPEHPMMDGMGEKPADASKDQK